MTAGRPRATLIEDQGRSAASEQFFRSTAHFEAEGVTHTLLVEGPQGSLRVPLVVRKIPGSELSDATSPYGYPGGQLDAAAPIDPAEVDWSDVPLVSIFVRDRVGAATCFTGGTLRSHSQIIDVALPFYPREQTRSDIRQNERAGVRTLAYAAAAAPAGARAAFFEAYRQTMARTHAAPRYLFSQAWFEAAFAGPGARLFITRDAGGEPLAGSLAVVSDGFLHAYLGGTFDAHLRESPFKNTTEETILVGRSLGLSTSLGGGLRPGDGMERFKRGFANAQRPFHTHGIVCHPEAYRALSAGRPPTSFFPAYRDAGASTKAA